MKGIICQRKHLQVDDKIVSYKTGYVCTADIRCFLMREKNGTYGFLHYMWRMSFVNKKHTKNINTKNAYKNDLYIVNVIYIVYIVF